MTGQKLTVNGGDTRERILQLLLEHNPASTTFIIDALKLPAAGVHRHIGILMGGGLAETALTLNVDPRG